MHLPDQATVAPALEDSSLARIRRHEREAAARVAEAHRAAAGRVALATTEAVTRIERARESGLREADRRVDSVLLALEEELAAERSAAQQRASRLRAIVAAEAFEIARELLPLVLPAHDRRGG